MWIVQSFITVIHVNPYYIHMIPLGITCTESGGLSSKNRSILYKVIPLGWVPLDRVVILYNAQGVKLKVGGSDFVLISILR